MMELGIVYRHKVPQHVSKMGSWAGVPGLQTFLNHPEQLFFVIARIVQGD